MNRYRKSNRLGTLVLLVCFLTTLSGVSADAGHACCGNCGDAALPDSMHSDSMLVSDGCCPSGPVCTCTFESADARDLPAYSIVYVSTTGDDQSPGLAAIVSGAAASQASGHLPRPTRLSENRPRSGPIYLTNQSFLC